MNERRDRGCRTDERHGLLVIDGSSLTCPALALVTAGEVRVTVSPQARDRVVRSFARAGRAAQERPIYGRSTGVGANRSVVVEVPDALQPMRLLRSHATSAGGSRDPRRIRALLVVRLNQLANGGSGINPVVLDGLGEMINADALPRVRELGGIGTGDLAALATVALALTGEGPVSGGGCAPIVFGPGDALPFLSSNAATIADAALAWADLQNLACVALVVAALSFVAARGNAETFAPAAAAASPFPGTREVCAAIGALIGTAPVAARLQDPYAFRSLPQVHGAFLDALTRLRHVTEAMANVASENPLIVPEGDTASAGVFHHGAFYAASLAQALDAVNAALVPAARLGLTRLTALSDPVTTGGTPFLADDIAGSSGIMGLEYVAGSALGDLFATAHPVGTQSVTLSLGAEEGATFAAAAARSLLNAVQVYQVIIAAELVAAIRAIRMCSVPLSERLADVVSACAALPAPTQDRDLSDDLDVAASLFPALRRSFDVLPAVGVQS